jgi:hypothetical protein
MPASPLISTSAAPLAAVDAGVRGPDIVNLQRAGAVARERIAALPGVRVLGADVGADLDGLRLAVDIRDTGRDGWQVACVLAGRGVAVEAAGGRALVVRLRAADVEQGMQERLAPALLQALWSVPARRGFELALDLPDRSRAPRR